MNIGVSFADFDHNIYYCSQLATTCQCFLERQDRTYEKTGRMISAMKNVKDTANIQNQTPIFLS